MVKPWDATFNRQFPQEKANYIDAANDLLSEYAKAITNHPIFPDASDQLAILSEHILRTQNRLKSETDAAWAEMQVLIKKAHKLAVPAIKDFLEKQVPCSAHKSISSS